jgi:hypothetical protein
MNTRPRMIGLIAVILIAAALPAAGVANAGGQRPPQRVYRCHGHRATIHGNNRRNTIVGTNHADVIWAGGKRDEVYGRGGNDIICGNAGSDIIDGMAGLDPVYAGAGADWCLAVTHREHMRFHHGCDVHVNVAPHHHHPHGEPGRATVRTRAAPARAIRTAQRKAGGNCGNFCYAGVPSCGTGLIRWSDNGGVYPRVSLGQQGYIAIGYQFWNLNNSGQFNKLYDSGYGYTGLLQPGVHSIIPSPALASAPDVPYQGAGVILVYFSFWDGTQWSQVYFDYPSEYRLDLTGYPIASINPGDCST